MKTCDKCMKYDICGKREVFGAVGCVDDFQQKQQTNADKIRSMSDEELAEFLINIKSGTDLTFGEYVHFDYTIFSNTGQIIKWLQSEVSE